MKCVDVTSQTGSSPIVDLGDVGRQEPGLLEPDALGGGKLLGDPPPDVVT